MGFMKGFGSSFSTSFENARTRRAAKERDAFQVAYDSFQRNSTQYEADRKADEALINSAKTLVSQAGLPEETWGEAYKRLKAGFSVEKTDEWLRTNKFSVTPATDAPDEAQAPSSVDGQMEQLGQVDPASTTTDPTMGQPTDVSGGLLSEQAETATAPQTQAPEGFDQANQEVMNATGTTPEQMAQYNQGYQSPPLPTGVSVETIQAITDPLVEFGLEDGITDAKLAAAKVRADQFRNSNDPNLQAAAERFDAILPSIDAALATEDGALDPKLLIDLMKPSGDLRADIRNQATATQTLAAIGKQLDDMARETPEVLTMTGTGVSGVVNIANEVNTLFGIIGQMGNEQQADENAVIGAVKDWEAKLLAQGVPKEIAAQQAQFASLQVRFIYAAGKAMGQQGNGFSNYDFDNIMKSIKASTTYPAYSQNLRRLVGERTNEVQNMIDLAMESSEIQVAMQNEQLGQMLMTELTAMDDRLDPTIVQWLNEPVQGAGVGDNLAPPADPIVDTPDPSGAPESAIEITDETVRLYPEVFTTEDIGKKFVQNEDNTVTVY